MSNLAEVFAGLMSGTEENKEARIARSMEAFGHSRNDALIVDEAVCRCCMDVARTIGAALDALTPRLLVDALPLMLEISALNVAGLSQAVTEILFGVTKPTPGCDCDTCELIKRARIEFAAIEADVKSNIQPTRH